MAMRLNGCPTIADIKPEMVMGMEDLARHTAPVPKDHYEQVHT